jgi:tetratricopeptide (TPR) repeat protein
VRGAAQGRGRQENTLGNKPNNIRKKALEHAKKGHWEKALEEFLRLVEVEQHNPNLFNEIGDIQLKLANKREAFKHYHAAIAAYARVGLLNNAVAVCKKILRLNPADDIVYGRMATLRQSQGFSREAAAYALQYLERVMKRPDGADESARSIVLEIVQNLSPEPDVLERAAECLAAWDAANDAGDALEKLEKVYLERRMAAEAGRTRAKLKSLGRETAPPSAPVSDTPRTEEKPRTIETHRPSAGEAAPGFDAPFSKTVPSHIRRGHGGDAATDFGVIDVGAPKASESKEAPVPIAVSGGRAESDSAGPGASTEFQPDSSVLRDESAVPTPASVAAKARSRIEAENDEPVPVKEYEIPLEDAESGIEESFRRDSDAQQTQVRSARAGSDPASEVKADVEAGDYRSHYDLGMAYLEMHLLPEAIREFQYAAQSPVFKVRSLEMIGRCFITQKQPDLAIKQLSLGLALVDGDDRLALGIKYSLALAYEMVGEPEKAKTFFQDVYVVDGSFRDVGEKVRKYAS